MSKYDDQDTRGLVEGRGHQVATARAAYRKQDSSRPTFVKIIILDVISDPSAIDDVKMQFYKGSLGVGNAQLARNAPRNSIIGRRVMGVDSGASEAAMIFYPFFPSHISLPAKPGEHVWAIFENPDAPSNIGYWICKVPQPSFVDDVNYTHADRQADQSFTPGIAATAEGSSAPIYEFRNGGVDSLNGERYTVVETVSMPGGDDVYTNILTKSDSSQITWYEPVPRYRKRPADVAFEGSNNTLIVLGNDRTGPIATYTTDPTHGQVPEAVDADAFTDGAGSIDIVVGRGQTPATGGTSVDNKVIGKEIAKDTPSLAAQEGDPDLIHDRSRVLVAMQTNADVNFGIDSFLTDGLLVGTMSDKSAAKSGAIVAKSDRVRIIGRSDIALMTTSQGKTDSNNLPIDSTSNDDWATIGIKSTGDVYIQPIAKGSVDIETPKCNITVNPEDLDISTTVCDLKMDQTDIKVTVGATSIDANAQGITSTIGATTSIAETASGVTVTTPQVTLTAPAVTASGTLAVAGAVTVASISLSGGTMVAGSAAGAVETIITALNTLGQTLSNLKPTGTPADGSAAMTALAAAGTALSGVIASLTPMTKST